MTRVQFCEVKFETYRLNYITILCDSEILYDQRHMECTNINKRTGRWVYFMPPGVNHVVDTVQCFFSTF